MSSTLIDVIIKNNDSVQDNLVEGCPFNDHKFFLAALDFNATKPIDQIAISRCLNDKSLEEIKSLIEHTDFSIDEKFYGVFTIFYILLIDIDLKIFKLKFTKKYVNLRNLT